jgi:hypothetical protein
MLNPSRNFGNANDNLPINGHTRYFIFNPANVAQMNGLKNMLLNGMSNPDMKFNNVIGLVLETPGW